ncbi:hypothetical protein E4U21_003260 [Claviceps maximensis]|nr:hypothetical protein E4U21_003260 [Claviceps maximensis]
MGRNKKRLYVALYPSGVKGDSVRKFHWAFIIGPKAEAGKEAAGLRCHVKNPTVASWFYDETNLKDVKCTVNLLARILIAKIEDEAGLLRILRETPVVQNDRSFTCRTWLVDAFRRIWEANPRVVGTSELDWSKIEARGREYVEEKLASGRYGTGTNSMAPKPTWDMINHKEIIP